MKQTTYFALIATGLLLVTQGFAQESTQIQSPAGTDTQASEDQARSVQQLQAPQEQLGWGASDLFIRPQAGAIVFNGNERLSAGVLGDINLFKTSDAYFGFATGALFSGLNGSLNGSQDFASGFSTGNSAYIFQVPLNVKVTFAPNETGPWRLAAHTGGNMIYSSGGVGNRFGYTNNVVNSQYGYGAAWNAHYNVGADVDYMASNSIAVGFRYDITFSPAFTTNVFTLGVGLKA